MKRILHEEELSKLEKSKQSIEDGSNRMSERHYEAEMRRRQDELEQIRKEGKLIFDCSVCGTHGDKMVGHQSRLVFFLLTMFRTMVYIV